MSEQRERPGFWSGALFGMIAGMASLVSFQYLSRILHEPHLISTAVFSDDDRFENRETLAMFIAAESLKAGIRTRFLTHDVSKRILHAGYRNFRESWARDFGFAAYGLTAVGQHEVVRDTLEAFFWHQRSNGQLPVKLHSMNVVTRFLHSTFGREQSTLRILKPKYRSGHGAPSLDGHALLVISALHYCSQTDDSMFLREYWSRLELAMQWLAEFRGKTGGALLYQDSFSDWADSVARKGRVLYTNVIYWKALREMARAAASLDLHDEATRYVEDAEHLSRTINEMLWRPELGYFATSGSLNNLSSDGNLLAIAWGLAKPDQAASILQVMEEAEMAEPIPTRVAHPSYPPDLIAIENRLGGLSNYHTDSSWLWLGAWHLIAFARTGEMEEAAQILKRIVDVIVKDRQVHEVHRRDGEPLASFWYKSEAPLTWNAGMILYAHQIYEKQQRREDGILSVLNGEVE